MASATRARLRHRPAAFATTPVRRNQYVADWSGNIALNYEHPLTENLLFRSTLDTQFTTSYNPSQNLDPRIEQDGYATWNLRVAVALGGSEVGDGAARPQSDG